MIWPRDRTLQRFEFSKAAVAVCLAMSVTLSAGIAAARADDGSREKLIGTFEIRSSPSRGGSVADDDRRSDRRAPDTRAADPGRPSPSARRNFLTGEAAVPQSIDDIFRRDVGDRVFFGSGSAEIGARARTVIALQAEWLKRNPQLRLTIEGHADDGGTAEENIKIALARAEALRERLIADGVEARRIAVVSRGREDRLAACSDSACMAQNRRALVVVHAIGSGERIGLDRARQPAPPRPGEADGGRRGPVPR